LYLCYVKILLLVIAIYLAYQLLVNLIIPVYKTSRKIKQGFHEMHQRMKDQMDQQNNESTAAQPAPPSHADDYIEFEELSE
jgi:hypothetical protein